MPLEALLNATAAKRGPLKQSIDQTLSSHRNLIFHFILIHPFYAANYLIKGSFPGILDGVIFRAKVPTPAISTYRALIFDVPPHFTTMASRGQPKQSAQNAVCTILESHIHEIRNYAHNIFPLCRNYNYESPAPIPQVILPCRGPFVVDCYHFNKIGKQLPNLML